MTAFIIRSLKTLHTFFIDLTLMLFITALLIFVTTFQDSSIYFLSRLVDIIRNWFLLKIKPDSAITAPRSNTSTDDSNDFKSTTPPQSFSTEQIYSLFSHIHVFKTPARLAGWCSRDFCTDSRDDFFKKNYFLPSSNLNLKSDYVYLQNPNTFSSLSFVDSRIYFEILQNSLQQFWPLNYPGVSFNDLRLFSNLNSLFSLPTIGSSTLKFFRFNKIEVDFSKFNDFYTFLFRQLWFKQYFFTFKKYHHRLNMFKVNEVSRSYNQLSLYSLSSLVNYVSLLSHPRTAFIIKTPSIHRSSLNYSLLSEGSSFLTGFDFDFFSLLTSDSLRFNFIYIPSCWERRWCLHLFTRYYRHDCKIRSRVNFLSDCGAIRGLISFSF